MTLPVHAVLRPSHASAAAGRVVGAAWKLRDAQQPAEGRA
jgi:hypothetical protein